MKSEKIQDIAAYQLSVSVFHKFYHDGLITEKQYRKCEAKIAEKFGLSLCSIYRSMPLTYRADKS